MFNARRTGYNNRLRFVADLLFAFLYPPSGRSTPRNPHTGLSGLGYILSDGLRLEKGDRK